MTPLCWPSVFYNDQETCYLWSRLKTWRPLVCGIVLDFASDVTNFLVMVNLLICYLQDWMIIVSLVSAHTNSGNLWGLIPSKSYHCTYCLPPMFRCWSSWDTISFRVWECILSSGVEYSSNGVRTFIQIQQLSYLRLIIGIVNAVSQFPLQN